MSERKIETLGSVKDDGSIRISYKDKWLDAIKNSFPAGTRFRLTAERIYNKRSLAQNAYLHGYLFPEARKALTGAGWDEHEVTEEIVKDFLKEKFLKTEIYNEKTGEYISYTKNTSELTTIETMYFIDQVIKWAGEYLHYTLLEPNEQVEIPI